LGDYIVGSAVETIDTERLIGEFQQVIVDEVYQKNTPMDAVAEMLKYELQERGAQLNSIEIENIYSETETSKKNVELWQLANDITEGRKKVVQVRGTQSTAVKSLFISLVLTLYHRYSQGYGAKTSDEIF